MVEQWLKISKLETRMKPIYFYYFNHFNHFNHKYIPHVGSKKNKRKYFFLFIYTPPLREKTVEMVEKCLRASIDAGFRFNHFEK